MEYTEVLNGGGSGWRGLQRLGGHAQVQRILRTRHEYPEVIVAAYETRGQEDLMTLPGESWSWQRRAKEHLLHHCGHFRTLRRVIVMIAGTLVEGTIGGFERQHEMLCQIYRILKSGAEDNGHDLVWGWPLLGLSDPDVRPDVQWSPAETSTVVAWHRKAAAVESAKKQLMTPIGKATPKVKNELTLARFSRTWRCKARQHDQLATTAHDRHS